MTYTDDDRAREVVALRAAWVDGYVRGAEERAKTAFEPDDRAELFAAGLHAWAKKHPDVLARHPEVAA